MRDETRDDIYDEVAAELTAIVDDARHDFTVKYDLCRRDEAVLQFLCRLEMALESAKLRLAALSPTWRGVN